MKVRLHITKESYDRMTLNDLIAFEEISEGKPRARELRNILARFAVGEDGSYLPDEEARQAIGELPLGELEAVSKQFSEELEAFTQSEVPPGGGEKS